MFWGSIFWTFIHTLSFHIQIDFDQVNRIETSDFEWLRDESMKWLVDLIQYFVELVMCSECRTNAKIYISSNPIYNLDMKKTVSRNDKDRFAVVYKQVETINQFRFYMYRFHNHVNMKTKSDIFPIEKLCAKYGIDAFPTEQFLIVMKHFVIINIIQNRDIHIRDIRDPLKEIVDHNVSRLLSHIITGFRKGVIFNSRNHYAKSFNIIRNVFAKLQTAEHVGCNFKSYSRSHLGFLKWDLIDIFSPRLHSTSITDLEMKYNDDGWTDYLLVGIQKSM